MCVDMRMCVCVSVCVYVGQSFGVNGPEILLSQQMAMSSPSPNPNP